MVTKAQAGTSSMSHDNIFTRAEVRALWPNPLHCGNCRSEGGDLQWSKGCEQLLCAQCRVKRVQALRKVSARVRVERQMGFKYTTVKGTYIPPDYGSVV